MTFNDFKSRPNLSQYLAARGAGEERFKLGHGTKYSSRPPDSPFKPSRFGAEDLLTAAQSKKPTLNPRLGLKPFEELFKGIGKFDRSSYNFETGVSDTVESPVDDPEFDVEFAELYQYSPVIPPDRKATNPFPTASNPDPKGYLASMGESKLAGLLNSPPSTEDQAKNKGKMIDTLA